MQSSKYALLIAVFFLTVACDDDDENPMNSSGEKTFTVTIENISDAKMFAASGVFNTPDGDTEPGPATPGKSYSADFYAPPGSMLSFATMMVPSNDFFFAPGESGIALWQSGTPVSGDITGQIRLWDAGTEVDEEPGSGANQPQRGGPNSGSADPDNTVRLATDDFGNLPALSAMVEVRLIYNGENNFTLRITNVSNESTLSTMDGGTQAVPLAPGVWVLHTASAPLFASGQADRGQGLKALAEDGDAAALGAWLASETGWASPLAPGVYAAFTGANPLFVSGQADAGEGLEALAEDGDPTALAAAVAAKSGVTASGAFTTPVGAGSPGPLMPGASYRFSFKAAPGAMLNFATMLVQSNDLFFAAIGSGIPLFNGNTAIGGDISASVGLWDGGTEVNQHPGTGPDQAPRQAGPDTGADENGTVVPVNDGFSYPAVNELIRVTVSAQ